MQFKYRFGILTATLLAGLSLMSLPSRAASLMDVYLQARHNDSSYKQAEADWLAAQENVPIARAALLPNLYLQAGGFGNYQNFTAEAAFAENGGYPSTNVALTLTQPIFNYALWKTLESAEATVKAATANFCYAQQDLITRTVQAYLNVLQAHDILRFTRANKAAFAKEYDTAKQKFDVGLVPITDVYDAQAKYDQSKAQEIAKMNAVADSLESLHQITGEYYRYLDGLSDQGIPLANPTPNNIDAWSVTAGKQNYQLQAQHFTAQSAYANIGVQYAGELPSFGIQGSFTDQRQFNRTLTFVSPPLTEDLIQQLSSIGIGMNLNIFSGGSVVAKTRQARFQYASASAKEETVYRQVVASTRKAFLGVNSYSAQVKADAQSIKSAHSALESARAGYQVGTRTLLDVLDDTTQLYQSQQAHAVDQYAYINNFIALKEAAGTLSPQDVEMICTWLNHAIDLQTAEKASTDTNTTEPRQPTMPPSSSVNTPSREATPH